MNRDVFISYSRKNYNAVMEIKSQIDDATGADCWMDLKGGIETGAARYDTEIIEGIKSCNVFLFMLSNQSQESENAIGEIDLAKARGKRIVLVNIDNCELNDYFILHYGRADIIYWQNALQREKLLRDVKCWIGGGQNEDSLLELIEKRLLKNDIEIGDLFIYYNNNSQLYGFVDSKGNLVIPPKWKSVSSRISDNRAIFDEGLARVEDNNGKWGFIDKRGTPFIPCRYNFAYEFKEGLAQVRENKWGYIDKAGHLIIPCIWDGTEPFSEGLAGVMDSYHNWGYINKKGSLVIPCQWNYIQPFRGNFAIVQDNKHQFWKIDKTGNVVSKV